MHDIENMDGIPPAMSELPGWPKVIGTISIVWASLGLLCGGCGMIFLVAMPTFMKGAVEKLGPMPPPMLPSPEQMVLGGIGFLWAIVLLVAGITTVTRRPIGRPLHLIHGAVAIILGVLAIFFQVRQQGELAAWAAANADSGWAKQMNAPGSSIGRTLGLAFTVLLSFAWPCFCLAWFAPSKRSAQLGIRDVVF
jgi:hypothetical protein